MNLPIDLKLPEGFLDEETRDGYVVTEKLKKIWAVELDLLAKLQDICQRHNIHYQVFAGTLLGTIRHMGFIPWDDDLDIGMTRKDFNKLQRVADKEFKGRYFLQTGLNQQQFFLPFARLRNSDTTGAITWHDSPDYNNGIYIDIFILEGCEKNVHLSRLHDFLLMIAAKTLTLYHQSKPRNSSLKESLLLLCRPVIKLLPYSFWYHIYSFTLGLATPFTDRIGLRIEFTASAHKYWLTKKQFKETTIMPFEFLTVPVPREYDTILSHMYGNYMEFPPIAERGAWHEGQIYFNPDIPYKEYFQQKALAAEAKVERKQ